MNRLSWQIFVVFCHGAIGLLSLSIAIPPGFSSPIWPAAAVGAAAFWKLGRHAALPIFISAFSLNFLSKGFGGVDSLISYVVIAVGTVLQGAVGGSIARRLESSDPRMSDPVLVLKFLTLLIFVSCFINASFSVPLLGLLGLIPSSSFLANWLTWWIGDAMGMAILFCPLFLWFSSSGPYERKRALAVSLLSVFLLVLFVPLYMLVVHRHEAAYFEKVSRDAEELVQRLESIRNQNEAVVTSLSSIKESVPALTSEAFTFVTTPLMKEFPAIKALEWAQRVKPNDRMEFEARIRNDQELDFYIHPKNLEVMDPKDFADNSMDHFPVTFVSPMEGNESALGLDLASEPNRAESLFDSIDNNRRSTTKPIILVQELQEKSYGYLTFSPVFLQGSTEAEECLGVIVGVFRFADIVEAAIDDRPLQNYDFVLRDRREPATLVYSSFAEIETGEHLSANHENAFLTLALSHSSPWEVQIYPSVGIYDFSNWWQIWLILFGGSILVYLANYYFTIISAQPELVKQKIEEKTSELQATSATLMQLNDELEERVAERTVELTDSNKELNLFVSAVSHDLRAPLAKLNMFVTSLHKSFSGTKQSVDTSIALGAIDNATHSMTNLISGMLDLSRKSHQNIEITNIPLDEIIHQVLVETEDEIKSSHITIDWEPLPTVRGDTVLLTQLYFNLLSNSIKFTSTTEQPNVKISKRNSPKKDEVVLTVEDNGIGIPADKRSEVFTAFSRVHTHGGFPGSGIGLSICERIVKRLGGRIWIEDSDLGGAKFCFILKTELSSNDV